MPRLPLPKRFISSLALVVLGVLLAVPRTAQAYPVLLWTGLMSAPETKELIQKELHQHIDASSWFPNPMSRQMFRNGVATLSTRFHYGPPRREDGLHPAQKAS